MNYAFYRDDFTYFLTVKKLSSFNFPIMIVVITISFMACQRGGNVIKSDTEKIANIRLGQVETGPSSKIDWKNSNYTRF